MSFKKKRIQNQQNTWQVQRMNTPIKKYIRTIKVNMERCRWIDLRSQSLWIYYKYSAFKLTYSKKKKLESNLLVGKTRLKQWFSAGPSVYFLVRIGMFQKHWKRIKTAIFQDENYLESHGMEWNNGNIRQRPGQNPMGLVKFMFRILFIYDTPIKVYLNLITVHLVMGVSIWTKPRNWQY
jgi:murein L,D-transpeptidase YcbB/YkuD